MRRWFAISGLCHGGLLVALIVCSREQSAPPHAVPIAIECVVEPALDVCPRERDLEHPPQESSPDGEPIEIEAVDEVVLDEWFEAEPQRLPVVDRTDPRQLTVHLPRPLRRTQAPSAQVAPVVRGATRAPALLGGATRIAYPRRARRRGLEGTVELRVLVHPEGWAQRVVVARSSGHALLDEAAKSGVATWRFAPALRDGTPVAAWTRRKIHFRLAANDP